MPSPSIQWLTPKLTHPTTSLVINFTRCNLLNLAQEIARGRGSVLNALLAIIINYLIISHSTPIKIS